MTAEQHTLERFEVCLSGLGGQGVLKASDILAAAAFRARYDVKKSELHGMSQRGGSVTSDVRFGEKVFSPMVPDGEADYVVVLAPEEVENSKRHVRPGGVLISPTAVDLDALPNKKSFNVAMLGVLSAHLDIPEDRWLAAIEKTLPAKFHDDNVKAFQVGRSRGAEVRSKK